MNFLGTLTASDIRSSRERAPFLKGTIFHNAEGVHYVPCKYVVDVIQSFQAMSTKGTLAYLTIVKIVEASAEEIGVEPPFAPGDEAAIWLNSGPKNQSEAGSMVVAMLGHSGNSFEQIDPALRLAFGHWMYPSREATAEGKDEVFLDTHGAEVRKLALRFKVRTWKKKHKETGEYDDSEFWQFGYSVADPSKAGLSLDWLRGWRGYPMGSPTTAGRPQPQQQPQQQQPQQQQPQQQQPQQPQQGWSAPGSTIPGPQSGWANPQQMSTPPVVAPPPVAPPPVALPVVLPDGNYFNQAIGRYYYCSGGKAHYICRLVGSLPRENADWVPYVEGKHPSPTATIDLPF